jgi:hypothetical protein
MSTNAYGDDGADFARLRESRVIANNGASAASNARAP